VTGAGAVNALAVNQNIQVALLEAPEHNVVRNPAFADFPDSIETGDRLAYVLGGALPHFADFEHLAPVTGARFEAVLPGRRLGRYRDLAGEG